VRAGSMPRGGRIVMRCMPFFILPFIMSFPSVSCNLAFFCLPFEFMGTNCSVRCVCNVVILP